MGILPANTLRLSAIAFQNTFTQLINRKCISRPYVLKFQHRLEFGIGVEDTVENIDKVTYKYTFEFI